MTELNPVALAYALDRFTGAINDLLVDDGITITALDDDIEYFISDYADYEEKNWLTTQE